MQTLLEGLNVRLDYDVPLAPLTWYGLGGPAKVLAHPSSVQQLSALAARCHEAKVPVYVLGAGANLLVADEGVDGVVVQLDDPSFKQMRVEGARITAGSGFDLAKLVLETARLGLSGLECLAGIPATVGGAVRMNAGGAYGEIGPSVRRVHVMGVSGQCFHREREDLIFSYRRSNISARFILEVEFELTPADPDECMRCVKEIFLVKKNSQPLADHSAGCAFKNPPPPPEGPGVPAGRLIDSAGLKGYRVGGAEISPRHANFIVAHQGCTARNVLDLLSHVQKVVLEKHNVTLEREVVVWGA